MWAPLSRRSKISSAYSSTLSCTYILPPATFFCSRERARSYLFWGYNSSMAVYRYGLTLQYIQSTWYVTACRVLDYGRWTPYYILVMCSHYARAYWISYVGYRINAVWGKITSLFLLAVRSIACSSYLHREVGTRSGQLACHHKYRGMLTSERLLARVTFAEYAYH